MMQGKVFTIYPFTRGRRNLTHFPQCFAPSQMVPLTWLAAGLRGILFPRTRHCSMFLNTANQWKLSSFKLSLSEHELFYRKKLLCGSGNFTFEIIIMVRFTDPFAWVIIFCYTRFIIVNGLLNLAFGHFVHFSKMIRCIKSVFYC